MSEMINTLKDPELSQFQEDLAKTYFSTSQAQSKPRPAQRVRSPAAFFLLLLGFAAILFVVDKIEIDIRVIPAFLSHHTQSNTVFFDRKGEPNRDIIKEIVFFENASAESGWGKKFITLATDIASKKASLAMEFVGPLNMENGIFSFLTRGAAGGEEMRVTLKDASNNLCYSSINTLANHWQQFTIAAAGAKNFIDPRKVVYIKVELNPGEKELPAPSKIYLKGLCLKNKED